ncbi:MAG: M13 family peptidase, partial [Sphingomicrobium sp.]
MNRLLILAFASTALSACATQAPPPLVAEAAPVPAEVAPPPAPKPTMGSYGFDVAGMDTTVLPGNDFFGYANGTWAKSTPIPADKSNYGMFTMLDDLSRERTRTIIEEAAKDPSSKMGLAYGAYVDTATIEGRGLDPIRPWLNEVAALGNKADYPALAAKAGIYGIGVPFGFFVGQDDKNPDRYVPIMFQGGIGMPDRDYYLLADPKIAATRAKYLEFLTAILIEAGVADAAARAKAVLAYETKIARVHWTQIDSRDSVKTYNLMTLAQLRKKAPGFDFNRYLADSRVNFDEVIVAQPSAVTGIAKLIATTPLQVLKDQLTIRSISSFGAILPSSV